MMLGERLAASRERAGKAQVDLAVALGRDRTLISHVEAGRSGLSPESLVIAATELEVSVDYLLGLTDDPTPVNQRKGHAIGETRAGYDPAGGVDVRYIAVLQEVAPAAGSGAEVYSEEVTGWVPFRKDWLAARAIDREQSSIVSVSGDSMEPTLPDGCSILVDRSRREPHDGRIYVLRTEDGLVVKRLGLDEKGRWLVVSDNPEWGTVPLIYGADIIGEVRWSAVTH